MCYGCNRVTGIFLKCDHIDCGNDEKVWLPYFVKEHQKGLKPHPFCIRCGSVKNIGSDRAVGRGYFMNVISRIEKHLQIPGASVRMRLAAKELENMEEFDDAYTMSRYAQERIFIGVIKKYYQIPDRTIQQFL